MRVFALCVLFYFSCLHLPAQPTSGTIKVRRTKQVKGLYVLEEGTYYKIKLYLRLFDDNAAVFLKAPIDAKKARDSTASLLYTYRKSPAVYKVVNDSLFIEGSEDKAPFLYRGIVKDNRLRLRKHYRSSETPLVFKKLM